MIKWSTKGRTDTPKSCDISIRENENANIYTIVFKNNAFQEMKKSQRVMFGTKGNRLYFTSTNSDGWKLSYPKGKTSRIAVSKKVGKDLERFKGDYRLKFDESYKLPYIEI